MAEDGASTNARVQCASRHSKFSPIESKERKSAQGIYHPLDTLVNIVGSWALLSHLWVQICHSCSKEHLSIEQSKNHSLIKARLRWSANNKMYRIIASVVDDALRCLQKIKWRNERRILLNWQNWLNKIKWVFYPLGYCQWQENHRNINKWTPLVLSVILSLWLIPLLHQMSFPLTLLPCSILLGARSEGHLGCTEVSPYSLVFSQGETRNRNESVPSPSKN